MISDLYRQWMKRLQAFLAAPARSAPPALAESRRLS